LPSAKKPGGHLSGFTQYDDGVYSGNAPRLVRGAIAYRNFAPGEPLPGGDPAQTAVLRPRYRLRLVEHQRSLTMFLLTRAP
jgi:hypothetical protein